MTLTSFRKIVHQALNALPQEFKQILENNQVGVVIRTRMPRPVRQQYHDQIVLGMFIGVPFGHETSFQTEPTRIELYKESFEKNFTDHVEMKHEIAKTVIHEVGHYFGFSEKRLKQLHLG